MLCTTSGPSVGAQPGARRERTRCSGRPGPSEGAQIGARDALRNFWTFRGRTARCKEGRNKRLWTASGPAEGAQTRARDALHNLWTFRGRTSRCQEGTNKRLWTASGPSEGPQIGARRKPLDGLWTVRERAARCKAGTKEMLWTASGPSSPFRTPHAPVQTRSERPIRGKKRVPHMTPKTGSYETPEKFKKYDAASAELQRQCVI